MNRHFINLDVGVLVLASVPRRQARLLEGTATYELPGNHVLPFVQFTWKHLS